MCCLCCSREELAVSVSSLVPTCNVMFFAVIVGVCLGKTWGPILVLASLNFLSWSNRPSQALTWPYWGLSRLRFYSGFCLLLWQLCFCHFCQKGQIGHKFCTLTVFSLYFKYIMREFSSIEMSVRSPMSLSKVALALKALFYVLY